MGAGDHVWVRRVAYTHHGVEVADGMVIHFTGTPGSKRGAVIRSDFMEVFARGATVQVRKYAQTIDRAETMKRAESKLGASGYNLYQNNCEHFARWCVTGKSKSSQVNAANTTVAVGASTAVAAGGVGVIGAVGATAGLSGPGIMSGLAAVGGTVGAGAVGGLVVLGVAPGLMGAAVMNVALRDDQSLPDDERGARSVGRKASVAGAASGGLAGVAAVSATGAVAGLSAAGITSGLATIGGVVGGGMAAGSAIVIAGPAIAAAGLGYGAYRVTRRLRIEADKEHPRVAEASDWVLGEVAGLRRRALRRRPATDSRSRPD